MYSSQKGISLFLTIIVLSVVLGIVLGLSTILVGQMKTLKTMGDSVVAFYAADAGVEQVLKEVVADYPIAPEQATYSGSFDNEASFSADIKRCPTDVLPCTWNSIDNPPPAGIPMDAQCTAYRYCVRSVGTYKDAKRAIEIVF